MAAAAATVPMHACTYARTQYLPDMNHPKKAFFYLGEKFETNPPYLDTHVRIGTLLMVQTTEQVL